MFKEFIEKNNMPALKFHGLRHSVASILLKSGMSYKDVAKVLGHADGSSITNMYIHAFKSAPEEAANIMEETLNRASKVMEFKDKKG